MANQRNEMFLIKLAYWLGIIADALWAIGLFVPQLFGILTGRADFDPDLQIRLLMGLGGTLMTCWTLLLFWAVRKPIERRVVILLTALVVIGLTIVTLIGILKGDQSGMWILIKTSILLVSMITSYILANNMARAMTMNE